MAVSGTTSFTVTRDQVIEAAMRGLSVLEEGAQPSATSVINASMSLNLIIKNWQKDGIKLWTISEIALPLVASQTSYTIGPTGTGSDLVSPKPLKVIQSYLRNVQVTPPIDIPIQVISRQEYNTLGSKFSTGTTNSIFYTPNVSSGVVNVYLTPDLSTVTNYVLYMTVQRSLMDMVKPTDNFDFPAEWFLALKWALMAEMASDYDKSLQDRGYYDVKAILLRKELEDFDVEDVAVRFVPDMRMQTGGFR